MLFSAVLASGECRLVTGCLVMSRHVMSCHVMSRQCFIHVFGVNQPASQSVSQSVNQWFRRMVWCGFLFPLLRNDRRKEGWMDGRMNAWMDGWTNECMHGWMDGWIERRMAVCFPAGVVWRSGVRRVVKHIAKRGTVQCSAVQ